MILIVDGKDGSNIKFITGEHGEGDLALAQGLILELEMLWAL